MIPLALAELAGLTGGRLVDAPDPGAMVTGAVVFDSRQVGPGDLFLALPGEHVDGHHFAAAALDAGAAAVVVTRPVGGPAVVVDDVLTALGRLAQGVLGRLPGLTIVGITGSSGKTSTKDLVADLLAGIGPTVAPPGSFNNEIGLPYTVLLAGPQTRCLVLEYSARGIGHITALCAIARPHIAVELNVGTAHIGEFGSAEAIAVAKGELVSALASDGVAVLNADDQRVRAMAALTTARVVLVGTSPDADVRAEEVRLDDGGRASYTLVAAGEEEEKATISLPLVGAHHVANSLAAAAVALELGLPLTDVAAGLHAVRPRSRWRMEVVERPDGVTVVNDAYNANPESMAAALRALVAMSQGRRSWAVIGPMAELGDRTEPEHLAVGRLARRLGVDRLVVVGAAAAAVHAGAVQEGSRGEESAQVPDIEAAVRLLRAQLHAGDVVLVKASRAAGLERLADQLLQDPA
ncbi:MAG: UDP-N-acetylmuramoyl-tripeptide--D-alanyl-D-alanine ligase [Actinomycetota bacterium]|nr:UDP-N-acetylmuramoyl-tripeptide--D-alanyl-D-alanine ligase [Actinomycetota bacterium]